MKREIMPTLINVVLIAALVIVAAIADQTRLKYEDAMIEIERLEIAHDENNDCLSGHVDLLAKALHVFTDGHPVVFTAYNAHESQTDNTPTITASGATVAEGQIALSRDLLNVYGMGGDLEWGDTVWVVLPMRVEDSMNSRWRNRADLYMTHYVDAIKFGKKQGLIHLGG